MLTSLESLPLDCVNPLTEDIIDYLLGGEGEVD